MRETRQVFNQASGFILVLALAICDSAWASNGYQLNGWGVASRGMSGAGIALEDDAMGAAGNPASIAELEGNQWQIGSTILHARPSFRAGEIPAGEPTPGNFAFRPGIRRGDPDQASQVSKIFFIPYGAATWQLDDRSNIGVVVYGNGGLNATYQSFDNSGVCPAGTPQRGILCFGDAGSDIAQIFIAPTYARRVNDWLTLGANALVVGQSIEIRGLGIFAGQSQNPDKLTNNDHDYSYGYGGKVGAQAQISPRLRAGLTYQTRVYMTEFDEYSGLLAEDGDFDIPSYVQFGLAWDAVPRLTLVADFQKIFFNSINSLGNSSASPGLLGEDNGPGFGWEDVEAYKVGALYRHNATWTWRAGYTRTKQPVRPEHVSFNLLAGSVLDDHLNFGFSYKVDHNSSLGMAFLWAPRNTVSGPNPQVPGQQLETSLEAFTIDIAWQHRF